MFGLSLSLPPLVGGGGVLVWELVGKDDLLSDHLTTSSPWSLLICASLCHRSLRLTTFAFRSSEVRRLLFDLDHYGA